MAVTSIMTTEGEIDGKAGAGASASYTEAMKDAAVLRAEGIVNDLGRYDFSTNWAALTAVAKTILGDIVSSFVAMEWILYDTSAYIDRNEAADKINALRDSYLNNLSILKNKDTQKFIKGT
jgi:hypothetical protein